MTKRKSAPNAVNEYFNPATGKMVRYATGANTKEGHATVVAPIKRTLTRGEYKQYLIDWKDVAPPPKPGKLCNTKVIKAVAAMFQRPEVTEKLVREVEDIWTWAMDEMLKSGGVQGLRLPDLGRISAKPKRVYYTAVFANKDNKENIIVQHLTKKASVSIQQRYRMLAENLPTDIPRPVSMDDMLQILRTNDSQSQLLTPVETPMDKFINNEQAAED